MTDRAGPLPSPCPTLRALLAELYDIPLDHLPSDTVGHQQQAVEALAELDKLESACHALILLQMAEPKET